MYKRNKIKTFRSYNETTNEMICNYIYMCVCMFRLEKSS